MPTPVLVTITDPTSGVVLRSYLASMREGSAVAAAEGVGEALEEFAAKPLEDVTLKVALTASLERTPEYPAVDESGRDEDERWEA